MAVSQKDSNVNVPNLDAKLATFSICHLVDFGYFCKDLFIDVIIAKELWHSKKDNTLMNYNKNIH
jgi:hypothetical protein